MRLALLRPVNGWRGFFTELAIVVLGILLALLAQQAVESWRWRGDVREFRKALDNELGYNLAAYRDRLTQQTCVNRRLDQLDAWHRGLAAGRKLQLTSRIGRPTTTSLRTSVWESRTADITSHLGLEARTDYASLYDAFANYENIMGRERVVWGDLLDFEGAAVLSPDQLLRLRGLIERNRLNARLQEGNYPLVERRTRRLGIRAVIDPDLGASERFCDPLTWREV